MSEPELVIEDSYLNALIDLGGKDFAIQMVDAFFMFAQKVIGEARAGLATGNPEPIRRMGHSLCSSGRTFGIIRMKELGSLIEKGSHEKPVVELLPLVDEMEQVFTQAKACLEKKKAGL